MVAQQKILRVFKLINLLKQPGGRSVKQLSDALEISIRSVQRYIQLLEEIGLFVEKDFSGRYFLCVFDDKLQQDLQFTHEESQFLNRLLLSTAHKHSLTASIQKKIYAFGEISTLPEYLEKSKIIRFINELQKAIDQRRQVVLKNYHSANSLEITDRLIEPLGFDDNYSIIQSFEVSSRENKFFKLERIGDVVILSKKQVHQELHQMQHQDCFGYAGHEKIQVQLRLTLKAFLQLREEYPSSIAYLQADKDHEQYIFDGPVYHLEGVGRFVLGYLDQIEILKPLKLVDYVKKNVQSWITRHKLSLKTVNFTIN